jgi:ATP-dependent Clp protease ATP-binding subunit ClpC
MNFEQFHLTPSAKKALKNAKIFAEKNNHLKVIDFHLLHSLIEQDHMNLSFVFAKCGIDKNGFIRAVTEIVNLYKEPKRKKQIYCPNIKLILESALAVSEKYKSEYIGVDHIFWGVLHVSESIRFFIERGGIEIDLMKSTLAYVFQHGVESELQPMMAQGEPFKNNKQSKSLDDWCLNLNQVSKDKGIKEVFGRDKEINRLYEILLKKNKCNAILVGEAGTGKTAIVEGLAEKIVNRECPDLLLSKEVYCLDITSILSGTIYRGQMEEKIKNILELVKSRSNVILFIDEIHTIIGAGGGVDGGLDLANILKPVLSRGEISCIGATTKQEYEKYFKRDSALNRRFEKIDVNETSKEETFNLLMNSKKSYENFHMVSFDEDVIKLIVDLCENYLPNKKFPDKAFDILDESGAKTKMTKITRPQSAVNLEKKLLDPEVQKDLKEFKKLEKRYFEILDRWGKKMSNSNFSVDKDTIYSIFASKLETTIEAIKKNENIQLPGRIGF